MRPMRDIIAERESGRRPLRGNPDLPESFAGLNLSVEDYVDPWRVATPSALTHPVLPVLNGFQPESSRPYLSNYSFIYRVTPWYVLFRYCNGDLGADADEQQAILEAYTDSDGCLREECYSGWCANSEDEYERAISTNLPYYHLIDLR